MVLPMIFNQMGLIGHIFAPLLFLAILFAGITSALGFLEPILSSLSSKFNIPRKRVATYLTVIGCIGSLMLTTGIGSYLVGIIDSFVNEFGILLLIGIQCIIFGWIYGLDYLVPILNENATFKVGKVWMGIIKYVLPIFLILIWTFGIVNLFKDAGIFQLTIDIIIFVVVFIVSLILTKFKSFS
jgi:NSS family neurotransmitter:Na+ symporter